MYHKIYVDTFKVPAGSKFNKIIEVRTPGVAALEFSAAVENFSVKLNDMEIDNQYANFEDWNELRYLDDISQFIPADLTKTLIIGVREGDKLVGYNGPLKLELKGTATTGTGDIKYDVYAILSEVTSPLVAYKDVIVEGGTGGQFSKTFNGFGNMKIVKEGDGGATYMKIKRNGQTILEYPPTTSITLILGKNTIYNAKDETTLYMLNTSTNDTITIALLKKKLLREWNPVSTK